MEALLVINAGSSSLKFQIFGIATAGLERQVRAKLDGIATQPRLKATAADGTELINRRLDATAVPDLPAALSVARDWLATLRGFDLRAIGHRVVHGGPDYVRPVLIETTVLDRLASYQDLAPLHQPNNLAPIRLAMEIKPDVPQVPVSTRPSIGAVPNTPIATPCRAPSMSRVCGAMAFMGFPMNISPVGCARWRRRSPAAG